MLEHYKEILCYVQRLTNDKDLAKDLTQDTYIRALEVDKKSTMSIEKSYLYKIARNLVIDKVRRSKVITQMPYDEETHCNEQKDSPEGIIYDEFNQEKLKECIQNLPRRNKQAFVLYLYKGYSRKEISEIMGISTNAVEKNITRATLKIKEEMKKVS